MAKAKKTSLNFNILPENVLYTNISKSSDYNSARVTTKLGDKAYMSVSIEWAEEEATPDIVMDIMDLILKGGGEKAGIWKGKEIDYEEAKKLGFI
ncbi:hypothetical protein KAW18_03620 [candidate division WOR-3 bacterium]|nr:hypothetical protein [Candidatus Parcubacteria bacterium]MCK4526435.1 hypothetical protein [candidate division WOR-3 bacterium]